MDWYDEDDCLRAVRFMGRNLKNVKHQTEQICIEAIESDSTAFIYVKNKTNKLCLLAVRKNGFQLRNIKKQTEEVCIEAVKQYGLSLKFVKNQTPLIVAHAIVQNHRAKKCMKIDWTDELEREIFFLTI